jgi:conjugative transposon TraN protein
MMKNIFLYGVLLSLCCSQAIAQSILEIKRIEITYNKTSSLVFTTSIISVDRGSRDILAQKAQGVHNVLQLKAARENFPETNLTVITADGMLHQFAVTYARQPRELASNITASLSTGAITTPMIFTTEMSEPQMEHYSETIEAAKPVIRLVNDRSHKMKLGLRGIYAVDDILFFRMELKNRSNVTYDVDYLRLFIRDKKKAKRTSSQELIVKPLFVHGNDQWIEGTHKQTVIYAVRKFTIPDAKKLYIEIMEKAGGRHLSLPISNHTIVNAKLLED